MTIYWGVSFANEMENWGYTDFICVWVYVDGPCLGVILKLFKIWLGYIFGVPKL